MILTYSRIKELNSIASLVSALKEPKEGCSFTGEVSFWAHEPLLQEELLEL